MKARGGGRRVFFLFLLFLFCGRSSPRGRLRRVCALFSDNSREMALTAVDGCASIAQSERESFT